MKQPNRDVRPNELSDELCWRALSERDQRADGRFYYAVESTGVYCRPSCPARRPRRENVSFHMTCEAAERAGFRACKRCRPNGQGPGERRAAWVGEACRALEQSSPPDLATLAAGAGLSRFHFLRMFKAETGLTPKRYAQACRAARVKRGLADSSSVTAAIYDAGFVSSGRFYEASRDLLGMTPSRYRAGGRDTAIRFALTQCALGVLLVAATEQGVCTIELGDDGSALLAALRQRFPNASFVARDAQFESWVQAVVGFVERPELGLNLPLDIRGTAFQQRVFRALQEIPLGSTVTYAELARRVGSPGAARAVGSACAGNVLALAIPCHRVVQSGGKLAGYRWGVERKSALLEREAEAREAVPATPLARARDMRKATRGRHVR